MIDAMMRVLGWGKVNTIKDDGNAQNAQVQLSTAQIRDNTPVLGLFGVISNPPDGSDAAYIAPGGDPSRAVVIGTNHQPSRYRNAPRGAGGVYDEVGSYLILTNDTNGELVLSGKFTIKIGEMTVVFTGSSVVITIGGASYAFTAASLAAMGAMITSNQNIIAGLGTGDPVTLQLHKHPTAVQGAPSVPTPGT